MQKNLFLDTLRGQTPAGAPPPVWMMRQAGRYLQEYRELREQHGFLAMVQNPEAAAEATLQPIRRYGMDAAIIFSDIMVPLIGAGIAMEFAPGPVLQEPLSGRDSIRRLARFDPQRDTAYLLAALRKVRAELQPEKTALIGFAGAPLTLAAYLIEGRGSKDFETTRAALLNDEVFALELFDRLAEITGDYLQAQVEAGAQALQLFDSWSGVLGRDDWERLVKPSVARILERAGKSAPVIYFAQNAEHLYGVMADLPAQGLSVDWRLPLAAVNAQTGGRFVLQGNLDPARLLGEPAAITEAVLALRRAAGALPRGFILNMGHGNSRHTPLENAGAFVNAARLPL
jgi:uroporphyrinogen decarboxylase